MGFRGRLGVACAVVASLGCAGLLPVDAAGLAQIEQALPNAAPDHQFTFLLRGAAEAGVVRFGCADGLGAVGDLDPSQRQTILAAALSDWTAMCPKTCAGDLTLFAARSPAERSTAVLAACDAAGPDPVFGGALASLRPSMAPLDYLVARMVIERADQASPTFASLHPQLAVGVVLAGAPPAEPERTEGTVTAVPPVDPAALSGAIDAIRACGPSAQVAHRVVVDPTGAVAAVAGSNGCVTSALSALTLPAAAGYTVID
ncbi:MAG: hypothetical protein ABMB14_39250, partial [Myxococcota bacterium]